MGDFTFVANVPMAVVVDGRQTGTSRVVDFRFAPSVQLLWEKRFGDLRVGAEFEVMFERFAAQRDLDTESVFAEVRVEFDGGDRTRWTPFLALATARDFAPWFAETWSAYWDVSAGVTKAFYWGPGFETVGYDRRREPGTFGLRLTASGGYRFAGSWGSDAVMLDGAAKGAYVIGDSLALQLDLRVGSRHYAADTTGARTELAASGRFNVVWTPDAYPDFEVTVGCRAARGASDRFDPRFWRWSCGPALAYVKGF